VSASRLDQSGEALVHVPAVVQAGERVAAGLLAESLGLLPGLGRFEHRLTGTGTRLPLHRMAGLVCREEHLVYLERLRELAPCRVQFRLLLVYAYEQVAEVPFVAQPAGLVEGGLRTFVPAESALCPGQGEQEHRHGVGVVVPALGVPLDAETHGRLGVPVPPVADLNPSDGVQVRRLQFLAPLAGEPLQALGDLLGALLVAGVELGVRVVVEQAEQRRRAGLDGQLFGLAVPDPRRVHGAGRPQSVGQLGAVPDAHVRGGVVVQQLDREHRVFQCLLGVAQMLVDVRPDQMGTREQHPLVVADGPLVYPPDLFRGAGDVARPQPHVGLAQLGPGGQEAVTEVERGPFDLEGPGQFGRRVPGPLVLDREECGRERLGVGIQRGSPLPCSGRRSTRPARS
jgi:hypothetical protein